MLMVCFPAAVKPNVIPVNMASLLYTPEEKKLLLAYAIFMVVPLGDTLTGKTSLIRFI